MFHVQKEITLHKPKQKDFNNYQEIISLLCKQILISVIIDSYTKWSVANYNKFDFSYLNLDFTIDAQDNVLAKKII